MATLTFLIEGEHEDLEWLRYRIDGLIMDEIAMAVEDGRIEDGAVGTSWEYGD